MSWGKVHIGRFCSIADGFSFVSGNHPVEYLTTHPFTYNNELFGHIEKYKDIDFKKEFIRKKVDSEYTLTIGNDVWIGQQATVLGNVKTIGNGAVIVAHSVVTKDVPPYAIIAGNPAKLIRYRFDDKTIEDLQCLQWWNLPLEAIKHLDFSNVPACIEELKKIPQHPADETST